LYFFSEAPKPNSTADAATAARVPEKFACKPNAGVESKYEPTPANCGWSDEQSDGSREFGAGNGDSHRPMDSRQPGGWAPMEDIPEHALDGFGKLNHF